MERIMPWIAAGNKNTAKMADLCEEVVVDDDMSSWEIINPSVEDEAEFDGFSYDGDDDDDILSIPSCIQDLCDDHPVDGIEKDNPVSDTERRGFDYGFPEDHQTADERPGFDGCSNECGENIVPEPVLTYFDDQRMKNSSLVHQQCGLDDSNDELGETTVRKPVLGDFGDQSRSNSSSAYHRGGFDLTDLDDQRQSNPSSVHQRCGFDEFKAGDGDERWLTNDDCDDECFEDAFDDHLVPFCLSNRLQKQRLGKSGKKANAAKMKKSNQPPRFYNKALYF